MEHGVETNSCAGMDAFVRNNTESSGSMSKDHKSSSKYASTPTEMSTSHKSHPTHDELYAFGKSLREKCPRESHAIWRPANNRTDPIRLLETSSEGRIPELIPIRYGRMLQSPFTFYRGAALNMAADLARTPVTKLRVQACGDCHLCNFGAFATPERRVIFDINDFDETLPAPWEWDVKRLAASFMLACRNNGFRDVDARDAVLTCVRSYREQMAKFAEMRTLDVWYASIDFEQALTRIQDKDARKRAQKRMVKATQRSVVEHDFPELVTTAGMEPVIKENPPLIFHPRERGKEEFMATVNKGFAEYRDTLPEHRRLLLDRFQLKDLAVKVVGVGSVGSICGIMLLMASDTDPLFLQIKQARPSVLEAFAGKSIYSNHGERVVVGTQLMQSASDLFLGWAAGHWDRQFFIRQLRDVKIKMLVELFTTSAMESYAEICGWTLARAHARSGEPVKISGYLGKSDTFDKSIADFSMAYADQCENDHGLLRQAVSDGRLEVFIEEP
jgi:uncharacterized protein (DUF2252 family)